MIGRDHTADVAAVLAAHHAVVSGDVVGWRVVCSCGYNEPGSNPLPHVAAALLASETIAQALAAVEAVARVEALADEWRSATCVTDGAPCSWHRVALETADELDAALRPEGGDQ